MLALASSRDDNNGVTNHNRFYFDDTLVVIQIEQVRFKVHKYLLLKSETFADMFAVAEQAKTEGKPVEGTSDESPIKLEGISASDFESLLTVLYVGQFSANQSEPESSLIIPAFRLANMWNFADLRAYLMPLAERVLPDVDKIAFAQEFEVDDWIIPAYTRLCQREDPLDSEEAAKIGMEGVVLISRIREQRYSAPAACTCTYHGAGIFRVACIDPSCNCSELVRPISDAAASEIIGAWIKDGRIFVRVKPHMGQPS